MLRARTASHIETTDQGGLFHGNTHPIHPGDLYDRGGTTTPGIRWPLIYGQSPATALVRSSQVVGRRTPGSSGTRPRTGRLPSVARPSRTLAGTNRAGVDPGYFTPPRIRPLASSANS